MRLTKTSAHAALATAFLATQTGDKITQARQVAEYLSIPLDSALKILQALARHRIIKSQLGRRGGYHLAKNPGDVTFLDIVEAIDGPIVPEIPVQNTPGSHLSGGIDLMQDLCSQASKRVRDELARVTIEDLVNRYRPQILTEAH